MVSANFIFGGNASFQVSNDKGDTYTFNIKAHKTDKEVFFVRVKKDAEGTYSSTYAGYYNAKYGSKLIKGQRGIAQNTKVIKVFQWAVKQIITETPLPEGYEISHIGRCGCCGRPLTDALSKDLGLGPVCLKNVKLDDRQNAILKLKALGF